MEGDKQPEAAAQQAASSRVPAIVVSLAALAVIGAATANSLPSFKYFSLPNFDHFALPDFNRFSLPNFKRVAAQPPAKTAPAPVPDPIVRAALIDLQLSQQQNAVVLASLTQNSATQQADLKRISRQLSSLAAQAEALQNSVTPLTTGSIPHSNPRVRLIRTSRKIIAPTPPTPPPVDRKSVV